MTTYTLEEQAANRAQWVALLRSGRFTQTTEQLARDGGHCCLGVACEAAMEAGAINYYDPDDGGLPGSVRDWLGFREDDDSGSLVDWVEGQSTLIGLNDTLRWSFAQIADHIEAGGVEVQS